MSTNIDDLQNEIARLHANLRCVVSQRNEAREMRDTAIARLNVEDRKSLESAERAERYRLKTLEQDAEIARLRAALEKVRAETFYGGSSGYYHMSIDAHQAVVSALKGDA